jgi:flagellin-like protein
VKKLEKITGNKKGINTILASLLMVVIVVVAAVMVYAWSTGLLGTLLVHPTTGQENLALEACNPCSFTGTSNVTMSIRELGTVNVTLVSYFVKDSSGNQYSRISWNTSPTLYNPPAVIAPNQVKGIIVLINAPCSTYCTLTGNAFTFTSGYSYTITMVTSRNTQFSFQVTR